MGMSNSRCISFTLGGMFFEYDEEKNKKNIEKHGISFKSAARIFFDYDRIEFYDEENSIEADRYDTIGNLSAGQSVMFSKQDTLIGSITKEDVLFVVYTERVKKLVNGDEIEVDILVRQSRLSSID